MPILPLEEVAKFAEKVRTKLLKSIQVRIACEWLPPDDVDETKRLKWKGAVTFATRQRTSMVVEFTDAPNAKYPFPNSAVRYVMLAIYDEVQSMPGAIETTDAEEAETQEAGAQYHWYDVTTWAEYVDGDETAFKLLPVMLRQEPSLGLLSETSGTKERHFAALVLWTKAARAMTGWQEGDMIELGKVLMNLLRDCQTEEARAGAADVLNRKLRGKEHPDDAYGLELDKMDLDPRKKGPRGKGQPPKKGPKCAFCGFANHTEAQCYRKDPSKAPKDWKPHDGQGFHSGGSGTQPSGPGKKSGSK